MNATLVKIDDKLIDSTTNINEIIQNKTIFSCRFHLPKSPPALPDFIVVRSDDYKARGGPNILGLENSDNLIPIPLVKIKRETQRGKFKGKIISDYRIGFKVECALVSTGFKLQGSTNVRQISEIKDSAHIPGLFYVVTSRTKHPKYNYISDDQWPN